MNKRDIDSDVEDIRKLLPVTVIAAMPTFGDIYDAWLGTFGPTGDRKAVGRLVVYIRLTYNDQDLLVTGVDQQTGDFAGFLCFPGQRNGVLYGFSQKSFRAWCRWNGFKFLRDREWTPKPLESCRHARRLRCRRE